MPIVRRSTLVVFHRYLGLVLAGFLLVAGLTGAVIAFDPELDAWLNPGLFHVSQPGGRGLSASALAAHIEAYDPRVEIEYLPLAAAPHKASLVFVSARIDPATGAPFDVPYDEIFIDPVSGAINGTRRWGACCFEPRHFVPFLFKLHRELLLPGAWGARIMGVAALLWLVLSIVGAWLTLPGAGPFWKKWRPAWKFKRGVPRLQLYLQLHRVPGLWLWGLLFAVALSGAAMNLENEVFKPVMNALLPMTPLAGPRAPVPGGGAIGYDEAVQAAQRYARAHGIAEQPGALFREEGRYGVVFGDLMAAGLGDAEVFVDPADGRILGDVKPGAGTAGDVFWQARFPLHSGRVAGIAGRAVIAVAGLATALMAVTGVVMWWKKRRLKQAARQRAAGAATVSS